MAFRRRRLMDWVDEFFGEWTPSWSAEGRCLEPLVDIEDREDEMVISIDLPCVESKEDVNVMVSEDSIEVRAEMRRALRWERWGLAQKHIEFTSFRKVIQLPTKVKPEESRAVFKNGVLRIKLPKARRKFTISVE